MNEHGKPDRSPRPPRPSQKLLTIAQASLETGLPGNSIRDLIGRGDLPSVRFGTTRRVWLRRSDLDQLIDRSVERVSA